MRTRFTIILVQNSFARFQPRLSTWYATVFTWCAVERLEERVDATLALPVRLLSESTGMV